MKKREALVGARQIRDPPGRKTVADAAATLRKKCHQATLVNRDAQDPMSLEDPLRPARWVRKTAREVRGPRRKCPALGNPGKFCFRHEDEPISAGLFSKTNHHSRWNASRGVASHPCYNSGFLTCASPQDPRPHQRPVASWPPDEDPFPCFMGSDIPAALSGRPGSSPPLRPPNMSVHSENFCCLDRDRLPARYCVGRACESLVDREGKNEENR